MLDDLDETIRQLLVRHVPLDTAEVDISFETPDREWSSRLNRPSINCYLYDVRENTDLRSTSWDITRQNGQFVKRKDPVRFVVTYQISVWARAPEDEHRLFWHVLSALARHPVLPEDVLQGAVREQPFELQARVAQPEQGPRNQTEFWQGVENRSRPTLPYEVTVALDPDQVSTIPITTSREIGVARIENGTSTPAAQRRIVQPLAREP